MKLVSLKSVVFDRKTENVPNKENLWRCEENLLQTCSPLDHQNWILQFFIITASPETQTTTVSILIVSTDQFRLDVWKEARQPASSSDIWLGKFWLFSSAFRQFIDWLVVGVCVIIIFCEHVWIQPWDCTASADSSQMHVCWHVWVCATNPYLCDFVHVWAYGLVGNANMLARWDLCQWWKKCNSAKITDGKPPFPKKFLNMKQKLWFKLFVSNRHKCVSSISSLTTEAGPWRTAVKRLKRFQVTFLNALVDCGVAVVFPGVMQCQLWACSSSSSSFWSWSLHTETSSDPLKPVTTLWILQM